MAEAVARKNGAAYVVTTWEEVLAKEKLIVTARVDPGQHARPFTLPIGGKLTFAVVEPGSTGTKNAAKCLFNEHLETATHTSKGRVYIGLSNYAVPVNYATQQSTQNANRHWPTEEQLLPVGTADPMNTRSDYKHMQPSLTAAQGRAFGDMATPLWIDAWQSDTIGIHPDPDWTVYNPLTRAWESRPTHVRANLSFLFYKFSDDVAIQRILADDNHACRHMFTGPLILKIYVEYMYTPDTTWSS